MIHYFDRSRMETDHKCPRKLHWEYYFDGKGLQPVRINQHLAFGSAVHEAIAEVLIHCKLYEAMPDMESRRIFIGRAKAELRQQFATSKGFQAETILEEGFDGT